MDDAERTKLTDLLLFSIFFFFFLSPCPLAHTSVWRSLKTNQNTSPEAPTPWLALMGMKHSSRCLLLRRKMAENAADSTEVSKDASRSRRPRSPRPEHCSLGRSSRKCRTTFPVPPASSCLSCCCGFLHLLPPLSPRIPPFSVGREVCPAPSPPGARRCPGPPLRCRFPGSWAAVRSGGSRAGGSGGSGGRAAVIRLLDRPRATDLALRQHLGQLPVLSAACLG